MFSALAVNLTANAALVTYTSQAAWEAAAGASAVETFASASVGNLAGPDFGTYTGFSLSGTTNGNNVGVHTGVVGFGGTNYPIPASFAGQNFFSWGEQNALIGPTITMTFSTPTYAFAFDWFNTDPSDQSSVTVLPDGSVYGAPPFTLATGPASSGFFGIVSDNLITSATFQSAQAGGYVSDAGFDNVRVAVAPVPEPTTALFGAALLGAIGASRRRRGAARPEPTDSGAPSHAPSA